MPLQWANSNPRPPIYTKQKHTKHTNTQNTQTTCNIYPSFDVDVTTDESPPAAGQFIAARVVIGGSSLDWFNPNRSQMVGLLKAGGEEALAMLPSQRSARMHFKHSTHSMHGSGQRTASSLKAKQRCQHTQPPHARAGGRRGALLLLGQLTP